MAFDGSVQNINVNGCGGCLLTDDSYPDWFIFCREGSSVTFKVPQVEGRKLKTIMCVVYTSTPDNIRSNGLKNMLVKNYTKATIQLYKRDALIHFEDEEGERVVSSLEPGNKVEVVVVVFENNFFVKNTTICLVYDEPCGKKRKLYHVPDLNVFASSCDQNECDAKEIYTQEELTNDFIQDRKNKNSSQTKDGETMAGSK